MGTQHYSHPLTSVWNIGIQLYSLPTSDRFNIATESYGGRFAVAFANYFNSQNDLIDSGKVSGTKITVDKIAINKYAFSALPSKDDR
jgi:hypothetical protein